MVDLSAPEITLLITPSILVVIIIWRLSRLAEKRRGLAKIYFYNVAAITVIIFGIIFGGSTRGALQVIAAGAILLAIFEIHKLIKRSG